VVVASPADRRGDHGDASSALNFSNEGSRIAKLLEISQRVTVIVPSVAPFDLLHKLAECVEQLCSRSFISISSVTKPACAAVHPLDQLDDCSGCLIIDPISRSTK
jgi:hypothetical protein